ncbi:hypothetical protein [Streptomyces sp. SP18CM02]|uniref:hypothetical protein n=1 Tax=Streptomyces sp. SP18CM02 TaxID=2758571 RepID=UPI00168AECAB|nr:hypothetical protein [Streptomyces sp. SP18CM02]MBD3550849.1 hypothetical protein [Streptomyces sp. SP18CM02]
MTKPRLTYAQHDQLGARLAAIRRELLSLEVQLANAYPKVGPEAVPARRMAQARELLGEALGSLEDRLYDEHPRYASTDVYSRGRQ